MGPARGRRADARDDDTASGDRGGAAKPSECDIVVVIFWSRMGTPLPDDYRKPDGTPYLSGTEWEYLDALTAAEQSDKPVVLVYRRTEKCLLDQDDPEYEEKRTQYQRVKSFFAGFRNPDGSIRRGCNEYASPDDFRQQLDQHLRDIVAKRLSDSSVAPTTTPAPGPPPWPGSPFPGLRAFTPDDAPIFFGRGRETDALVRRLADPATRFIAVVAASGSGKSSLVAAGLLPRLKANAIVGSKDWLLPDVIDGAAERKQWTGLRFTPGETGDNPFLALAVKLAPLLPDESLTPGKVAARLESDPAAIEAYAADALCNQPDYAELLLFVDQFEELFSVVAERYRAKFVDILAAAEAPRVRTIVTMRADFYRPLSRTAEARGAAARSHLPAGGAGTCRAGRDDQQAGGARGPRLRRGFARPHSRRHRQRPRRPRAACLRPARALRSAERPKASSRSRHTTVSAA